MIVHRETLGYESENLGSDWQSCIEHVICFWFAVFLLRQTWEKSHFLTKVPVWCFGKICFEFCSVAIAHGLKVYTFLEQDVHAILAGRENIIGEPMCFFGPVRSTPSAILISYRYATLAIDARQVEVLEQSINASSGT